MKSIIKKIAMLSMLSCIAGNASLIMSSQKPTINEKQKASLQTQVNSLSEQFATLAQDAQLSVTLKNEYKNLTAAITDLLAPLKTGGSNINMNKLLSLCNDLTTFQTHLKADSQYQQYEKSNKAIVSNLNNLVQNLAHEFDEMKNSYQTVKIQVINAPTNYFIAAGTLNPTSGIINYSQQIPIGKPEHKNNGNGTYNFYLDYYYGTTISNSINQFSNQHKGSEFMGKTTWDVAKNIIS